MNASSPLAALQPQQLPFGHALNHWNLRMDHHLSNHRSAPLCPPSFNFRDISMQNSRSMRPSTSRDSSGRDYFNLKPSCKDSSPAANLAVDLSQNFHIDQSPLPPTPRRSLIEVFGKLENSDPMSTPPLPSPCPPDFDMDMTPLPHKPAFAQINVLSPTPEPSPSEDETMMMTSPIELPASPLNTLRIPDGRKPKSRPARLTRPDMKKAWSHTGVSLETAPLEKPAPFLFGSHLTGTNHNSNAYRPSLPMTLDDCFESPEKENFSFGMMSLETTPVAAPRPRSANQNRMFGSPMNGSPVGPLQRRPGAIKRPRTSYRRSNSMYEHPDKWLSDKKTEMCMEAIEEQSTQPELALPHWFKEDESIPRIAESTLVDVLDGKYASHYDVRHIIDCRFEYEFDGGHIDGAMNCTDREGFANSFWSATTSSTRTLLVFHCEFSEKRAPTTAMHFRAKDREMNAHRYPFLSYPDVYILDGGYKNFFEQHKGRCYPQYHISMDDEKHAVACERGLGAMKRPQKLSRAATFAFGEREHNVHDSPTGQQRNNSYQAGCMGMDLSPPVSSSLAHFGNPSALRRGLVNMRSISH